MPKKLTVAGLAGCLSRASGEPISFHARQIRHWAQNGIFWDATVSENAGPTAPREFEEWHLGRALLLSVLSAQGHNVDELAAAARVMSHLSAEDKARLYPLGTAYPGSDLGLLTAIEATRRGEVGWFFELYCKKDGEVGGGTFTTKPDISPIIASAYPVVTVLYVSAILPFMFGAAE